MPNDIVVVDVDPKFAQLLREKADLETRHKEVRAKMQEECSAALSAVWHKHYPKRAMPPGTLATQECSQVADTYLEWLRKARELQRAHEREGNEQYSKLAKVARDPATVVPVLPVDVKRVWTTTSISTYSSQGFGAKKYARESAEQKGMKATMYGLTPEIREANMRGIKDTCGWNMDLGDFEVWVNTTELGLRLLDMKPDIPVEEWIRACWKKNVNPKVYAPMLSDDLMDKYWRAGA